MTRPAAFLTTLEGRQAKQALAEQARDLKPAKATEATAKRASANKGRTKKQRRATKGYAAHMLDCS